MPKRTEASVKRTYRFTETLLGQLEREADKNRRAVNTQLEIILEEWFAQQAKRETSESKGKPAPMSA